MMQDDIIILRTYHQLGSHVNSAIVNRGKTRWRRKFISFDNLLDNRNLFCKIKSIFGNFCKCFRLVKKEKFLIVTTGYNPSNIYTYVNSLYQNYNLNY